MNDSVLILKHFCHECNKEIDVISDHKCGLCNSSFIEELSGAENNLTQSEDQPMASGSEGTPVKDNDCPICLVPMTVTKDDPLIVLKCQHKYHKPCIKGWFEGHNTCPLCRNRVNVSSYITPKRSSERPMTRRALRDQRDPPFYVYGATLEQRISRIREQMMTEAGNRNHLSHRPNVLPADLQPFTRSTSNGPIHEVDISGYSRAFSIGREHESPIEHRFWQ